jgi:hypothetical protein
MEDEQEEEIIEDDDSVYAPEQKLKKKVKMIRNQVIKKQSKYEGKKRGRKPGQTAAAIKAQAIEK